jgi:hypothetical protein
MLQMQWKMDGQLQILTASSGNFAFEAKAWEWSTSPRSEQWLPTQLVLKTTMNSHSSIKQLPTYVAYKEFSATIKF